MRNRWRADLLRRGGYTASACRAAGYTAAELFPPEVPIIFAFHGYPWLVHRLTYQREGQQKMHVRGYKEKVNIDTPLELAIRNETDRFSLAIAATTESAAQQNAESNLEDSSVIYNSAFF